MWALVLLVIYASQIFGDYVNPVGTASLGWKFYIYYCVWVTIIFFIVYFTFVETRGPTLEELALIFDDPPAGESKNSMMGQKYLHAEEEKVDTEKVSMTVEQRDV